MQIPHQMTTSIFVLREVLKGTREGKEGGKDRARISTEGAFLHYSSIQVTTLSWERGSGQGAAAPPRSSLRLSQVHKEVRPSAQGDLCFRNLI